MGRVVGGGLTVGGREVREGGVEGVGFDEVGEGVGVLGSEMVLNATLEFVEAGLEAAVGPAEMIEFRIFLHGRGL